MHPTLKIVPMTHISNHFLISSLSAVSNKYNGDQQLADVKWEKYMRTLQVKMAPDYNFSTKSVSCIP